MIHNQNALGIGCTINFHVTAKLLPNRTFNNSPVRCNSSLRSCGNPRTKSDFSNPTSLDTLNNTQRHNYWPHQASINYYTTRKRLYKKTFLRVPQEVTFSIMIPTYRASTPNILLLATVGWIIVTITIISCQTPWAPKSLTDKGVRDGLYMSIFRRMTTAPISGRALSCLNEY